MASIETQFSVETGCASVNEDLQRGGVGDPLVWYRTAWLAARPASTVAS